MSVAGATRRPGATSAASLPRVPAALFARLRYISSRAVRCAGALGQKHGVNFSLAAARPWGKSADHTFWCG
eukprot:2321883-Alexandrium_andersonii.AAC.1